jgi:polar amino acid transport system substrate-binding protein
MEWIESVFAPLASSGVVALLCLMVVVLGVVLLVLRQRKKGIEAVLEESFEAVKSLEDYASDGVLVLSWEKEVLYANPFLLELLSLPKQYEGYRLQDIKVRRSHQWEGLFGLIKQEIEREPSQLHRFEDVALESDDAKRGHLPIDLFFVEKKINIKGKRQVCTCLLIRDLRLQKEQEALRLTHQLTRLPNHIQALNDLNGLFAKLHLAKQKITVVLMGIDNFAGLQSLLGYEQANSVLKKFAHYLQNLSRALQFSVYHMEHNQFMLILTQMNEVSEVEQLLREIQNDLISFYKIEESGLHLTASAGIAMYPDNSSTLKLLDHAYKAFSQAESEMYGSIISYQPKSDAPQYDALKLYNDMHRALKEKEFELYYQPIILAETEGVVSAEALIRWNHKEYGFISPEVFIPIMEQTGFVMELGEYLLETVLVQLKRWELFKFKQIPVSINVTLLEIEQRDFLEKVKEALHKHQISPSLIRFEITESLAMVSENRTTKVFFALEKMGIDISLDDFGTGYTSFGYLKQFPAKFLKIDKVMIENIMKSPKEQEILKAMIALGHSLGMKVIVEGIEDQWMAQRIKELGANYIQGYYYSKPLPAHEFQKLLRK